MSKLLEFLSKIFTRPAIDRLDPDQVQALLVQSARPFLLDVRTPDEYRQGHISGAELIPLNELSAKKARIPKDRDIICICASGHRSIIAVRQLSSLGYKVRDMNGGMLRWIRAGLPVKAGMTKE